MKIVHSGEVESLRAEVRALQMEVSRLETRLANYEEQDDQQMRALWPYNWILSSVETVKEAFEPKRKKRKTAPKRLAPPDRDAEARFARMMM